MSQPQRYRLDWKNGLLTLLIVSLLVIVVDYLWTIFIENGSEKFVYSTVLIAAVILGVVHLILYFWRRAVRHKKSPAAKNQKRMLENARNVVNYITPLVLVVLLYHFWQKEWVLAVIIVGILLLDRINDLLRTNR